MAKYSDLAEDTYFLIRESEDDELTLVKALMTTTRCVLIVGIDGDSESMFWKKLDDELFEIADELTEEEVEEYESFFEEEEDDVFLDEEEDDEDDEV